MTRQGTLGASIRPVVESVGAKITATTKDGFADRNGMKVGDLILKIDSIYIKDRKSYYEALRILRKDVKVNLLIERNDTIIKVRGIIPGIPKEKFENSEVTYMPILLSSGHRVQGIVTKPKRTTGKVPGIFFVRWLSCDPVEIIPESSPVGIHYLLEEFIENSGYAVMRVEKPGLGDSEGPPCAYVTFQEELEAHKEALRAFMNLDYIDKNNIIIIGQSNGAAYAPLVGEEFDINAYVISGGWSKTWFEHMLEIERNRYELLGHSPAEVSRRLKLVSELYTEILIKKRQPIDVLTERNHLSDVWQWGPDHQYGITIEYHQQLQDLNLAEAWSKVGVPTLAIYGEFDWIMNRDDHLEITKLVNRNNPDLASFIEMPKMNHSLLFYESVEESFKNFGAGQYDSKVYETIMNWLKQKL
ncbi:serine aminopeptidase domain-containing protein [Flagellimonas meishanensis]|uniref:serine aminopeptidase domain-containing protein n=1 Tax=Flagellimonas meishanensis TaxID=2873264 RepID=UPI001CA62A81|nr:PDZ domain-containing protein [[Muricauda] meishanensis]